MTEEDLNNIDVVMSMGDNQSMVNIKPLVIKRIIRGFSNQVAEDGRTIEGLTKRADEWFQRYSHQCKRTDAYFQRHKDYHNKSLWQKIKIHFNRKKLLDQ